MARQYLRTTVLALSLLAAAPAAAADKVPLSALPAGIYLSDPTHTSLVFRVDHMGLSHYTMRFAKVAAALTLDPAKPAQSKLEAHIDPLSLRTDYPAPDKKNFDQTLSAGADWLDGNRFTDIAFKASKIEQTGDSTGRMTGDLTLHGITRPVTLDVTFNGAYADMPLVGGAALGFSAKGHFKRSDFGVSQYLPHVGDDIAVEIEIEFHPKGQTP